MNRKFAGCGLGWQTALVVAAWVYLCGLFSDNDGLWLQGDAPRHALNGLFWKDFLLSGALDPRTYALRYFARYPAVCPNLYPPGFYFFEAAVFGVCGTSPFVAKGLVLAFALLAGLYTMAWLRRWIDPAAGGAAALLLLSPGLTTWSHAIMLNVPALAVGLAALYHARRTLELPAGNAARWHLNAAAAFSTLSIVIYPMTGLVVFVALAWLAAMGRWELLARRQTLCLFFISAVVLAPLAYAVFRWAPQQLNQARPHLVSFDDRWSWRYYFAALPRVLDGPMVVLAASGLLIGFLQRRWRQETICLSLWIGVCYVVLSLIWAKDARYLLLVCPALICLATIALVSLAEWISTRVPKALPRVVLVSSLAVFILLEGWLAHGRYIPSVSGLRDVAEFVRQIAPAEAVIYDGRHNGVFTYYTRAGDPNFRQQVVRGDRLLIANQVRDSDPEAVKAILAESGCRWVVVEFGTHSGKTPLTRTLRQVLQAGEFVRVRSFPMTGAEASLQRVDVFEVREPQGLVAELPVTLESPPGATGPVTVRPIQR
ncbi:MAG: hypothetical protein ACT4QC_02115 [Planctomycetaceae bacterium]